MAVHKKSWWFTVQFPVTSSLRLSALCCALLFQISMDRGHVELVKQQGDGLAEAVGGLVHTARYRYCITVIYVLYRFVKCNKYYRILFGENKCSVCVV